MPPDSSIGFAPADWALALTTALFLSAVFIWRAPVQQAFERLAAKTVPCMVLLFVVPVAMRLLLLPHHPVPVPDIYDEFSHLLVADTLLHGRLANPPHPMSRFFETFFVLQQPSYSSIYPLGQGLLLALGQLVSGIPWTGVLMASGALCATCYWMLRAWVAPSWALLGGIFAIAEFGPLCQWTNSYWGGSLAAIAGCLVFGALPRLRQFARRRNAVLLGVGFGLHMLTRQFESVLLAIAVASYVVLIVARKEERGKLRRWTPIALATVLPFILIILLQNKAVTNSWTTLPEQLSQYQYGVPTSLTIESSPTPHVALTAQQELDYRAQALMHGSSGDSFAKFFSRLEYRIRYYRFFFLPPLYIALFAFLFTLRKRRWLWVGGCLAIFALGTNLFPYLLVHYLAAVTSLFVLISILGLQQLGSIRIREVQVGYEIVRVLIVLCLAEFAGWYGMHLFETPGLYAVLQYETWDSINHRNPERRIAIARQLANMPGQLLVFVHYSPRHIYQNEWVWNEADIDRSRIVYARDLGPAENQKLIEYYPKRKVLLLEADDEIPKVNSF